MREGGDDTRGASVGVSAKGRCAFLTTKVTGASAWGPDPEPHRSPRAQGAVLRQPRCLPCRCSAPNKKVFVIRRKPQKHCARVIQYSSHISVTKRHLHKSLFYQQCPRYSGRFIYVFVCRPQLGPFTWERGRVGFSFLGWWGVEGGNSESVECHEALSETPLLPI